MRTLRILCVDTLMMSYEAELSAIEQLVKLGATRVKVGELEVEFSRSSVVSGLSSDVEAFFQDDPPSEEEQEKEWERLQYWSSQ